MKKKHLKEYCLHDRTVYFCQVGFKTVLRGRIEHVFRGVVQVICDTEPGIGFTLRNEYVFDNPNDAVIDFAKNTVRDAQRDLDDAIAAGNALLKKYNLRLF